VSLNSKKSNKNIGFLFKAPIKFRHLLKTWVRPTL